jgi:hypothetical protein
VSAPEWITVEPDTFTIAPGATKEITITADVTGLPTDEWLFGNIEFNTDKSHPAIADPDNLLSENYEVWPPTYWTIEEGIDSCTWLSSATTGMTNQTGGSGLFADANSDECGDAMDTWLVSPVLDFSGYGAVNLSFKSDFNDFNGLDDGYVDVSVDSGTTWTNLLHYDGVDVRGPRTVTLDLSDFAGEETVQIRFRYTAPDWDWYWQVDDVSIDAILPGDMPISDVAIL